MGEWIPPIILSERLIFMEPLAKVRVDIRNIGGDIYKQNCNYKYSPGERVQLSIQGDAQGVTTEQEIYYNVRVIDSSVLTQLGKKKLLPTLSTMILLEDEVIKNNSQQELYFPHQYIAPLFHYQCQNESGNNIYILYIYRLHKKFGFTIGSSRMEKIYIYRWGCAE